MSPGVGCDSTAQGNKVMSSCTSSAVNLFLVRVEKCSSSFQSFECQLLFAYSCLEASSFPLWCLA